jgi:hypothetical protein
MDSVKKKQENPEKLDKILSNLEFPGEDEGRVRNYLEKADLPQKVMEALKATVFRRHRMRNWGLVAAAALLLLLVLGANEYVTEFLFFLQSAITMFLAILFSTLFVVGLIGLFINLDYSRLSKTVNFRDIEEFFSNLFHPREP